MRTVKRLGAYSMTFLLLVPTVSPWGLNTGRVLANVPQPKAPSKIPNPKSNIGPTVPANVVYQFQGHLSNGQTHIEHGSMTVTETGADGGKQKSDGQRPLAPGLTPSDPAPNQSGITASLSPTHGPAGSSVTVSGTAIPGNPVRVLMRECDFTKGLAEAPVGPDGRFSQVVTIPTDATLGTHGIIIVGGRSIGGEPPATREVPFTIDPPPPIRISGTVTFRDSSGRERPEVDVIVRVYNPIISVGKQPSILAETVTDRFGKFGLDILYQVPLSGCLWVSAEKPGQTYSDELIRLGAALNYNVSLRGYPSENAVFYGCREYTRVSGKAKMFATIGEPAPGSCPTHLGNFISMPGRGAPVINTFRAALPFTLRAGDSVQFLFSSGGNNRTFNARREGSLWVADVDMSEFPPGGWEVEIRIPPTAACGFEPSFAFTMIEVPWFNPWVTNPRVQFRDDRYEFSGLLPNPIFGFRESIDLGIVTLDNDVTFPISVQETLDLRGRWTGGATATARVKLLDLKFLNEDRAYAPSGGPFSTRTYSLPTLNKDLFEVCVPIPGLTWVFGTDICWCIFACCTFVGVSFTVSICLGGFINVNSMIAPDLVPNVAITPGMYVSLPIEFKLGVIICEGSIAAIPKVAVTFPLTCQVDPGPGCGFQAPCLELSVAGRIKVYCLGFKILNETVTFARTRFGCSGQPAEEDGSPEGPAGSPAQSPDIAPLSPQPTVAGDGRGRALAVWIREDSTDPARPDRRLYSSFNDGTTWSTPARINNGPALIEGPQVAFLGPNRAGLVWLQSKLSLAEALAANAGQFLSQSEIYYAEWNNGRWGQPTRITNDDLFDGGPALAADPVSGQAMILWSRANPSAGPGRLPLEITFARFDGRRWSTPAVVDATSRFIDFNPTVRFDRQGRAVALWLRDIDNNTQTYEDRQIVMTRFDGRAWGRPETIPNLPPGAYTPSLAFDRNNNPVIAFVVPPIDSQTGRLASGDGNQSRLYAAYRRGSAWEVTPVGPETNAERPVINVNADNRAIIMYRRFGVTSDVHVTGDVAAAVADLNASPLEWTTGYLTADGQTNWEIAFDIDQQTSKNFVVNVKQIPGGDGTDSAQVAEALAQRPKGEWAGSSLDVIRFAASGPALDTPAQTPPGPSVASAVVPYATDLRLAPEDITISNPHPLEGDPITLTANVRNIGLKATSAQTPITVRFYEGTSAAGRLLYEQRIDAPVRFNTAVPVTFSTTLERGGVQTVTVVVDQANSIPESDESNNTAQLTFGQTPAPRQLFASANPTARVVSLGWLAPETKGVDHYEIFRSTTAGRDYEFVGDTTATEFVDSLVRPGVTYYYVAAAVDIYGTRSVFSNEASGKIEIRNSNIEIRNKFKYPMTQSQNVWGFGF